MPRIDEDTILDRVIDDAFLDLAIASLRMQLAIAALKAWPAVSDYWDKVKAGDPEVMACRERLRELYGPFIKEIEEDSDNE